MMKKERQLHRTTIVLSLHIRDFLLLVRSKAQRRIRESDGEKGRQREVLETMQRRYRSRGDFICSFSSFHISMRIQYCGASKIL